MNYADLELAKIKLGVKPEDKSLPDLMNEITLMIHDVWDGWTSPSKAHVMAAMVIALRPFISLEVGVWAGKGLITLGLAHKFIGEGIAIGIDPYSQVASVEGQFKKEDRDFWDQDHEPIYQKCLEKIAKWGVKDHVQLVRQTSDEFVIPEGVGLLRIDGNHGPQAYKDCLKFAPHVGYGGMIILDDIGWTGGGPDQALEYLRHHKWRELYPLDDGRVFQR